MTITTQSELAVGTATFGRLYLIRISGRGSTPAPVTRSSGVYIGGPRADGDYWFVLLPTVDDGIQRGWPMSTSDDTPLPVRQAYAGRRGWWVASEDVVEVFEEVPVPDQPTVAATRSALAEAERSLRVVEQEFENFKETVQRVGLDYATRHGWCETYDRMLEEIGLPGRERTYSVEVRAAMAFTVNVEATSEDAARELVNEADLLTYVDVPSFYEDLGANESSVYTGDHVDITVESVEVAD